MGVRLYDPSLGRFLSVDPIEGGGANDYDYAYGDPINNYDLDGKLCRGRCSKAWKKVGRIARSKDFWLSAAGFGASVAVWVGAAALIAGYGRNWCSSPPGRWDTRTIRCRHRINR